MFGHQDEPAQQPVADTNQPAMPADNSYIIADQTQHGQPFPQVDGSQTVPSAPPVTDTNNLLEPQADDGYTSAPSSPAAPVDLPAPVQDHISQDEPATVGTPGPLTDLKQQALQQLAPLVSQLEQTPEEKFRTTMMMIQASDNQDLLSAAYEAANQISDEKAKAQALLDVINEINYFSQKNG